ncbi:MAG: ATP-dependent DNA helicase RecG [Armatimonadetes bacterium]|nr:ATP-dependent DNA helicase RecG [Armatimonadota bacterium]
MNQETASRAGGKPQRKTGLETEVQWLKGVGPKHAVSLGKLGIETVGDLLFYMPRRYEDRRNLPPIGFLKPGQQATIRGEIVDIRSRKGRGGKVILTVTVGDGTGHVRLIWFNQPWLRKTLESVKGEVIAFGMVKESRQIMEMSSPEWEAVEDDDDSEDFARITPVYPLTEGVQQWVVRRAARSAVDYFGDQLKDPLPKELRKSHDLPDLAWTVRQMHGPDGEKEQEQARRRLVFEEFLFLQLSLQMRRAEVKQEIGTVFPISKIGSDEMPDGGTLFAEGVERLPIWEELVKMLPFEMTDAQRRVTQEIFDDMERPAPMNRLLQGDVGSGKTAVAAAAMLAAVRCGWQAALMVPTEILAEQHHVNFRELFDPVGVRVGLLVGRMGARAKKKAVDGALSGELQIVVGTHALIQDKVEFAKMGLAIIDEQHRFGVMQRAALRGKARENPDVLVMTATPIPRTLTMTLYGDLDLSVIDEMPPGRKPIKTHWKLPHERPQVYASVRKLLDGKRQAYFVCPMITESIKMQTQAAVDLHYRLSEDVFKDFRVGLLHGQMKSAEKEEAMNRFRNAELDVLVSTVVIEVGVDVPNASVMVIEDANRFGLSQLHQLRGRVGRGRYQSYCVLIADGRTADAQRRLEVLVQTTDGFLIAEEDLRIRGPGDMAGTRQHGELDFRFGDLIRDGVLLEEARSAAIAVLADDPGLASKKNADILNRVKQRRSEESLITVS